MITARERIKSDLDVLRNEGNELLQELTKVERKSFNLVHFGNRYQTWYTKALPIVKLLGSERYDEFVSCYQIDPRRRGVSSMSYVIRDFLMDLQPTLITWSPLAATTSRFLNQVQILSSLASRIDQAISDVEMTLLSESQDSELDAAKTLLRINPRAAGVVAGVVLERHLSHILSAHGLRLRKSRPTINDMNDALKTDNIVDQPTWRKIQYLGDIRNECSHARKGDPTSELVKELIDGTTQIVKTIY